MKTPFAFVLLTVQLWCLVNVNYASANPLPLQDEPAPPTAESSGTKDKKDKPQTVSGFQLEGLNEQILFVPNRSIKDVLLGYPSSDTIVQLGKGSDDGVKVGYNFHVRSASRDPILIQVTAVQRQSSQARFLNHDVPLEKNRLAGFSTPYFPTGTLVFSVHCDETTWQRPSAMTALLNDLYKTCFEQSEEKPVLMLVDEQSASNFVDVQPLASNGFDKFQQPVVDAVREFLSKQTHISAIKLNDTPSPTSSEATELARRESLWPVWPSMHGNFLMQLEFWQKSMLQGISKESATKRIDEYRTLAHSAEQASITKADEVRSAMKSTPPLDTAEIDKLKSELREAVDVAFESRLRVQRLETLALTIDLQKVLLTYSERAKNQPEIVARRVDDLLNPNYNWNTTEQEAVAEPIDQKRNQSSALRIELQGDDKSLGWRVDSDGIRELLVQISPAMLVELSPTMTNVDYVVSVPKALRGRFTRVCVRVGDRKLERKPNLEAVESVQNDSAAICPATDAGIQDETFSQVSDTGQLQIIVAIKSPVLSHLSQKNSQYPHGLEYVTRIREGHAQDAATIVVRATYVQP